MQVSVARGHAPAGCAQRYSPAGSGKGSSTSSMVPRSSEIDGRQAVHANRAAVEFLDHGQQQPAVQVIEALLVDAEHIQRPVGESSPRRARRLSPRRNPAPGAAGGWRSAACRASGGRSRRRRPLVDPDLQDVRGALDDVGRGRPPHKTPGAARCRSGRAGARSARPARVVAPTRVNGGRSSLMERAAGSLHRS